MKVPDRSARSSAAGVNMTPMIDVVFQLLIFFLVSSHLAKQEAQLPLPLPAAVTADEPTDTPAPRVTLNVLADGSWLLAGKPVSPADLVERLTRLRRDMGADVELRLRVDRSAPYSTVEPVLVGSAQAGLWNVAFSVFRPAATETAP